MMPRYCIAPMFGVAIVGAVLGWSVTAMASSASAVRFPIRLSSDATYLVDQNARPFFINGDAAWSLIAQLSDEDAEIYLADRAARGFNTVLVSLLERKFATKAPANRAGDSPFREHGRIQAPNEAYFAHADRVIDRAAAKGLLVLLAPIYLGYQCGDEGWCAEVKAASLAELRAYGVYVGRRYADRPNIVWVIGGDADPSAHGVMSRLRAFVEGLRSADKVHLITAHNAPEQAAMDPWNATNWDRWLTLNNIYSYLDPHGSGLAQHSHPVRTPFFLIESSYENEHASTPRSLRRQAYGAVLAGAVAGHVFGNCPIWNFEAPSAATFCSGRRWQAELSSAGSATAALVGRLFTSRAYYRLIPDATHTVVAADAGTKASDVVAARTPDGHCIVAYVAAGRRVVANLAGMSDRRSRAWWFDPRTGATHLIGDVPSAERIRFDLPTSEDDWVLVIDAASLDLPAPGLVLGDSHNVLERVD